MKKKLIILKKAINILEENKIEEAKTQIQTIYENNEIPKKNILTEEKVAKKKIINMH